MRKYFLVLFTALLTLSGFLTAQAQVPMGDSNALFLDSYDINNKQSVITIVKQITGMGSAEATALVESAPVLISKVLNRTQTSQYYTNLTNAGANVIIYQAGYCNQNNTLEWYRSTWGEVIIKGNGAMTDYATYVTASPWINGGNVSEYGDRFSEYINSVTVGEGVTHIGSQSFTNNVYLYSITLPSTLTSIGDDAFSDCISLSTIHASAPLPAPLSDDVFGDADRRSQITVYAKSAATYDYWLANGFNVVRDYYEDPTACTYYLTITDNHQPFPPSVVSEFNFINVIPYINGVPICGPIEYSWIAVPTPIAGNFEYVNVYIIRIDNPAQYAQQSIEFHVVTHYSEDIVGPGLEIEANSLPMSGEYIIRDVSWGSFTSSSQMPVAAGSVYGTPTTPVDLCYIAPTTVATTPSAIHLTVGGTFNLNTVTFDFQPTNSTMPVTFEPEWSVGNYPDFMNLDQTGTLLTALAPTPASFQPAVEGFTDDHHVSIPVIITDPVVPVTGVSVTTSETQILWANGEWVEGDNVLVLDDLYTITPANATNQNITWTASNNCVSLSDTGNEFGAWYAYANTVGTGTLTVTTEDGGYTAKLNFEVRNHVENIQLSQYTFNMQRGVPFDMSSYVTVLPANAYNKSIRWECDAAAATINGNKITPKTTGEFILNVISVENPDVANECTVHVTAPAAGVYAVHPEQAVWIGEAVDLSIRFEPADATSSVSSWTSSNPNVVAISGDGTSTNFSATAKAAGTATLTVTTDNGKKATIAVTVKAHVSSLQLSEQTITVNTGSTTVLDTYLTVLPANAFDKSVIWAVSDTATVVTVSKNASTGKWQIKANRSGTTTLDVRSVDNPQARASLNVNVISPVTGVKTTSETQVLWVGDILPLGNLYTIIPSDATNQEVTWTTSNKNVIEYSGNSSQHGGDYATAMGAGTATLTVTTADGGFKGTIKIEVRAHVESIELSQYTFNMQRGVPFDMSPYVTVLPANAYNKSIRWECDEAAATINGNMITPKAIGEFILNVVSVENPNVDNECTVHVTAPAAGVYAVTPIQEVEVGDNVDLSIRFEPADATSSVSSWTSSNPNVVAISSNGTTTGFSATAKAAGTVTLTVTTDNGQTATIAVTVYGSLNGISLSVAEATLEKGTTLDLSKLITTEPASGLSNLTMEYFPSEESDTYFSVSENGIVTALKSTQGESYIVEIRVTDEFGNTASATITIGVTVSITAVIPRYSEQSICIGEEVNLDYAVTPADADVPDAVWSSNNENVVRVEHTDEGWKAYGTSVGTTTVILTLGDINAVIHVDVYSVVQSIELNTQAERIKTGETICLDDFIAAFHPEDAADKRVTWTADDETIASITQKNGKYYAIGLAEGITSLMVQSVTNPNVIAYMSLYVLTDIESITAAHPEQYVYLDTYVDLSVEILPVEAANRQIEWTLSDPEAGYFNYGTTEGEVLLQMTKYGDFTLTGTPDEGEHTCTIIIHVVKHVEEITLTTTERLTIDVGGSLSLDGLVAFTPEDAYNKEVIWTSNDNEVATVSCTDDHWTVNGISSGLTMLYVVSADNPNATAHIEVSVIQRVTGIVVEEPKQEIFTGQDVNMNYTILPAGADNQDVTWTCSDDSILTLYEVEDDYYYQGIRPGTATLTVTTDEGGYSATIEVTVRQDINEIQLSENEIFMIIGQTIDLDAYITAILPEDAYDKRTYWEVDDRSTDLIRVDDGHVATALAEGQAWVYVSAASGRFLNEITVWIGVGAESLTVDEPNQTIRIDEYMNGNAHINLGYTVLPENATFQEVEWRSTNPEIVEMGWTWNGEKYIPAAIVHKRGTVDLIATIPQHRLSDTIHVSVTTPEPDFIYVASNGIDIMKGETSLFTVLSGPEYSIVNPDKLELSIPGDYGTWKPFNYTITTDNDGIAAIEVKALTWGEHHLQIDYPGTKGCGMPMFFGQPIDLEKGWNWASLAHSGNPVSGIDAISLAFNSQLLDARTSDDALYLDPAYGLFGTLTTFQGGSYKIEVADDVRFKNHKVDYNINLGFKANVHEGWNWITYPFDQNYTLSEITRGGAFGTPLKGDRIVAKDGGFCEYGTNSWSGTLEELKENEGYMYYTSQSRTMEWSAPKALGQKQTDGNRAASRRTIVGGNDIWQYNHRLFADNMTIIATVSGLDFPYDCTIGAFVDGECRGMGTYVDGKFFITVHGKAGESIQFVIHDDATYSFYNVFGWLTFDCKAGSLEHPMPLKAGEKTTAIELPARDNDAAGSSYHDLSGRRLISPASGLHIKDGKLIYMK